MQKYPITKLIVFLVLVASLLQGCGTQSGNSETENSAGDSPGDTIASEADDNPAPVEPRTLDMGAINSQSTYADIQPGETHIYKFSNDHSSGYNFIAFVLRNTSGSFDPYLVARHNGDVIGENDNSYLAEDSPGAARVPDDYGICLGPRKQSDSETFEIRVSDATGFGSGSYELTVVLMHSLASDSKCVIVLP